MTPTNQESGRDAHHEANRRRWDAGAASWAERADRRGLWRRCAREPGLVLDARELHWLGDVSGKAVAVLGSGDNEVVFTLAGMGARVTSVDISEKQLEVAAKRALQLGLSVVFTRADVTDLSMLNSETFDLVYTGGHVAVWVSDLKAFYAEAARILRPGGLFLVSEYHPFRRPWKDSKERLELAFSYFDRGPHAYACSDALCDSRQGDVMAYEFNWTVGDYVGAVTAAGCELLAVEEFGDEPEDWEYAALKGLPRILLIAARRTSPRREREPHGEVDG